jgi:hypothetical protein
MNDGIYRLVIVSAYLYFVRVFVCTLANSYLLFASMSWISALRM